MLWKIGKKAHYAAICLHDFCLWQTGGIRCTILRSSIISALDIDRGLQEVQQRRGRHFWKDRYIINAGQCGQHFGALHFRDQGSARTLEAMSALVRIQAKHQEIAKSTRL